MSPEQVIAKFPMFFEFWLVSAVIANIAITYMNERYFPRKHSEYKFLDHFLITLYPLVIPCVAVFAIVVGPFYLVNQLARYRRLQHEKQLKMEKTLKTM